MKIILTESQFKRILIETELIDNGTYIFHNGNKKSNNFTLIYGGYPSQSYGAKFMKNEIIDQLMDKNIIFSNYENSVDFLLKKLNEKYDNGIIKNVIGFSRGGLNAYNAIGKYNFIGLIDPSLPPKIDSSKDFNNVFMIFNPKNWSEKYRSITESQKNLNKILGNNSKLIEITHTDMVKKFIGMYKNKF